MTTHRADPAAARPTRAGPFAALRRAWRPTARTRNGGLSAALWASLARAVVLIADFLLALVTATAVIPAIAVWLHRQSGAGAGRLTADGTIAMWLLPLVFLVTVLAVGEIALMRALWRCGTRTIRKIRDRNAASTGPSPRSRPAAARTGRRSGTSNRKRGG